MTSLDASTSAAQDDSAGDGEKWNLSPLRSSCSKRCCSDSSCTICRILASSFPLLLLPVELRDFLVLSYAIKSIFDSEFVYPNVVAILSNLRYHLSLRWSVHKLRWSVHKPPTLSIEDTSSLSTLPVDVKTRILELLRFEDVFKLKLLSKTWKPWIEKILHSVSSRQNPKLTACYLFIENGDLQLAGFDPNWSSETGRWRRLPPFSFLPPDCRPDPELFKQFLMATNSGLVCMNLSKSTSEERLIIFNPLTQDWKELPPLLHRRNPVLIHLLVHPATQSYQTQSYQILVAGSSDSAQDSLSRITELYDSRTGKWERVGDLPGPAFAVNEYQSGVYRKGNIFCLGFVEMDGGEVVRGILGYDVAERVWSTSWTERALPNSTVLQLMENCGELYLFSEREDGGLIEHCVDLIEWRVDKEGDEGEEKIRVALRNVLKKRKVGGRSLEMYPEFVLVPYDGARRLCIYNTLEHVGEVVDVEDQEVCGALVELPDTKGFRGELGFFTLNPLSFVFEPRFNAKV